MSALSGIVTRLRRMRGALAGHPTRSSRRRQILGARSMPLRGPGVASSNPLPGPSWAGARRQREAVQGTVGELFGTPAGLGSEVREQVQVAPGGLEGDLSNETEAFSWLCGEILEMEAMGSLAEEAARAGSGLGRRLLEQEQERPRRR